MVAEAVAERTYLPHPAQQAFHDSQARIRVLACGARFGKDRACINDLIQAGTALYDLRAPDPTLIPFVHLWIVAPTFGLARQSWAELKAFAPRDSRITANESLQAMRWRWPKGEVLTEVKSADDPKRLVSVGLDYLLVTEASLIPELAWLSSLRPRLASPKRAGLAVLNSTPRGRNWFYHLYLRGQDPNESDYESWNLPSSVNPYIDPAEIERMRREMPDRWFRQEILAEFLPDAGGVFRNVRSHISERVTQGAIYIGVDWARTTDFTVFTAIRGGHVIDWDRMNETGYELQVGRLKAFIAKHQPALVLAESNSMGGPLVERLQHELRTKVRGFETTAQSKQQLIDNLAVGMENDEVSYPDLPQLINELEAYEYGQSPSGRITMNAPAGYHDDCVISLALAYWAQSHGRRGNDLAPVSMTRTSAWRF